MKKILVSVLLALGAVGCVPDHALLTPTTATSQGGGVTQVAAVKSPYQLCVEEYSLQGGASAPQEVPAKDEKGDPIFQEDGRPLIILESSRLGVGQATVRDICLRRVRLESEPQPQRCTQWGRGAPSWCWRLAGTAQLSHFGSMARLCEARFCYLYG